MLVLVVFAFISGVFTFLAPCIWPILPIIFSSSAKHKIRAFGVVLGVVSSFFILTLSASSVFRLVTFDVQCRCIIASLVIGTLGVVMLLPKLLDKFETWLSEIAHSLGAKPNNDPSEGFLGGVFTGLALGFVWAPCAGPIVGAVIALSYAGEHSWQTVLITSSYSLGFGIPLLIFAYVGNKFVERSKWLNQYTEKIQQAFGVMMILLAVAVCTGVDKEISAKVLDVIPGYSEITQKIESNEIVSKEIEKLKKNIRSEGQ